MNLIDKDAFSKVMKKRQDKCSEWVKEAKGNYRYRALGAWSMLSEVKLTLDKMPTIDAVEVVHGVWEVVDQEEPRRYGCSVCKRLSFYVTNYCPCCGAKIDGVVMNDEQTI